MTETTRPNILFVINPKSGSQKIDYEATIKKFFEASPWVPHFFILQGRQEAAALEKTIAHLKPIIITAVGGDGTISLVAKNIIGTQIKLGVIPAGSANGMAKELNISEDIEEALQIIISGRDKKIDVLYVNNLLCLHLSDLGLNARLIKYFEEGNMRGRWGYAKVALKVFFQEANNPCIYTHRRYGYTGKSRNGSHCQCK